MSSLGPSDVEGLTFRQAARLLDRAPVQSRLDHIVALAERADFKGNEDLEAVVMVHLTRIWSELGEDAQGRLVKVLAPRLARTSLARDPELACQQILTLGRDEDVRRALMVRPEDRQGWVPDPGDDLYPTEGWLGDYLEYAKHNEVPTGLHFWAGLGAFGAACRRNFYIEYGVDRLYMNQYIVFGSRKGTGKSVAMNAALGILHRLNTVVESQIPGSDLYKVNVLPEDTTPQNLVKEMADRAAATETHMSDGTVRTELGVPVQATAILALDELSVFLGKGTFSIEQKVPLLTTLWSRDEMPYEKGTATEGRRTLNEIALSMIACCAPAWLRGSITSDVFGGGFMERTHFIYREPGNRRYDIPPPFDPVQANMLAERLVQFTYRQLKERAYLKPEARDWYRQWYDEIKDRAHRERLAEDEHETSVSRRSTHMWKLAAMLCLSEERWPWIGVQDFRRADRLLEHEQGYFDKFIEQARESKDAKNYKYLERLVRKHYRSTGEGLLRSKLMQKAKARIGPVRAVQPWLDTLVMDGTLVKKSSKTDRGEVYLPGDAPAKHAEEPE